MPKAAAARASQALEDRRTIAICGQAEPVAGELVDLRVRLVHPDHFHGKHLVEDAAETGVSIAAISIPRVPFDRIAVANPSGRPEVPAIPPAPPGTGRASDRAASANRSRSPGSARPRVSRRSPARNQRAGPAPPRSQVYCNCLSRRSAVSYCVLSPSTSLQRAAAEGKLKIVPWRRRRRRECPEAVSHSGIREFRCNSAVGPFNSAVRPKKFRCSAA
jgi:hypothetical protein